MSKKPIPFEERRRRVESPSREEIKEDQKRGESERNLNNNSR